jgi:hypothetical protein
VFVIGPGERTHKLDAELRHRLIQWIAANPELGLDPAVLTKRGPRMPFALVTGIDEAPARELVACLQELGLQAETRTGGPLSHPQVRASGWTLTKRIALIIAVSMAGASSSMGMGLLILGPLLVGGAVVGGFRLASQPMTKLTRRTRLALPSAFDAALARVADVVPAMTVKRHRESLRGVVERAFALRDAVGEGGRAAIDLQIAKVVDLAALAASRLDQLEAELSADDLRTGDDASRARWHARDRWAATLLQVTAFLDAMRARAVVARAKGVASSDLDELRAQIEALEELTA